MLVFLHFSRAVCIGIKRLFKFALKRALKGILKHELSLEQFEVSGWWLTVEVVVVLRWWKLKLRPPTCLRGVVYSPPPLCCLADRQCLRADGHCQRLSQISQLGNQRRRPQRHLVKRLSSRYHVRVHQRSDGKNFVRCCLACVLACACVGDVVCGMCVGCTVRAGRCVQIVGHTGTTTSEHPPAAEKSGSSCTYDDAGCKPLSRKKCTLV